jgi:hypothetical protein
MQIRPNLDHKTWKWCEITPCHIMLLQIANQGERSCKKCKIDKTKSKYIFICKLTPKVCKLGQNLYWRLMALTHAFQWNLVQIEWLKRYQKITLNTHFVAMGHNFANYPWKHAMPLSMYTWLCRNLPRKYIDFRCIITKARLGKAILFRVISLATLLHGDTCTWQEKCSLSAVEIQNDVLAVIRHVSIIPQLCRGRFKN